VITSDNGDDVIKKWRDYITNNFIINITKEVKRIRVRRERYAPRLQEIINTHRMLIPEL
jgi:hypothetical protein